MWAIVERPITQRSVVAAFVAGASKRMSGLFTFTGLPLEMRISAPMASAPAATGRVIAFAGRDQAAES